MRSVKSERKSRSAPRGKPNRRGQGTSRTPVKRYELGHDGGAHAGLWSRLAGIALKLVMPKRPMLALTSALLLASLVGALIAGGYVSGTFRRIGTAADALVADAGFGISAIHLAGNARTQPSAIIAALGFEPGQSIFGADIQSARARLLALDWVADAQVRRQYPDSISVAIVEKLPFALWQADDGLYVIERSGRVITRARPDAFKKLPFFIGKGAPATGAELVDAVATHRAVVARVKAMQRVSERRWNLLLDDGVVVDLPETGWAKELDELEHLIVDKGVLERDISEIDLRSPDNLFFGLRSGDKQQQAVRGNST